MKCLRCFNTYLWSGNRAIRASSHRKPTSYFSRKRPCETIYQRRTALPETGGRTSEAKNRQASQYLFAETSRKKGTTSMETGQKILKESQRSSSVCPVST